MGCCWQIIIAILAVIIITVVVRHQRLKCQFVEGMWSNSKEDMFMYIDDKTKDSWRGGYLVSNKLDINEPFQIKTEVGVLDDIKMSTKKSKFLNKKMDTKLGIGTGMIEITSKDGKKYKLYKDTETSDDMKKKANQLNAPK